MKGIADLHWSLNRTIERVLHPLDYPGRQEKLEARLEKKKLISDKPKPLPYSRFNISQLWIPDQTSWSAASKMTQASQHSPFFRLPRELRILIYEMAIGYRVLHLLSLPKCIKHIRLPVNESFVPRNSPSAFNKVDYRQTSCTGLPLLLTCRTVYGEAIDILYSSNTFLITDLNALVYLNDLPLIRRQRMEAIRHLKVEWIHYTDPAPLIGLRYAPYDWATWERFWTIIKEMRLRSLDVKLAYFGAGGETTPLTEEKWMQPMLEVRRVKSAAITLLRKEDPNDEPYRWDEAERRIQDAWRRT